jgi:hypothetical protein
LWLSSISFAAGRTHSPNSMLPVSASGLDWISLNHSWDGSDARNREARVHRMHTHVARCKGWVLSGRRPDAPGGVSQRRPGWLATRAGCAQQSLIHRRPALQSGGRNGGGQFFTSPLPRAPDPPPEGVGSETVPGRPQQFGQKRSSSDSPSRAESGETRGAQQSSLRRELGRDQSTPAHPQIPRRNTARAVTEHPDWAGRKHQGVLGGCVTSGGHRDAAFSATSANVTLSRDESRQVHKPSS